MNFTKIFIMTYNFFSATIYYISMGKRKCQSNRASSDSPVEKRKTRSSTVNENERKKLLNHFDTCERNDVGDKIVRTCKYNATSKIKRSTVHNLTKFYNKGLF